jgi:hypothetical protein
LCLPQKLPASHCARPDIARFHGSERTPQRQCCAVTQRPLATEYSKAATKGVWNECGTRLGGHALDRAGLERVDCRKRRLAVSLDGETCHLATPPDYRIRKGALRVMVPPAKDTDAA